MDVKDFSLPEPMMAMRRLDPSQMTIDDLLDAANAGMEPVRQFFADYQCAVLEVETKFRVLSAQAEIHYDKNPIESIKTRVKSPESLLRKIASHGYAHSLDEVREKVRDIAGVRIVCSFVEDIYELADLFLHQDDVFLVERKDYIAQPKESGYRSLHLVVKTPIFTAEGKKLVYVEVQLRTIAMDFWASLEHKLRYKKNLPEEQLKRLSGKLRSCAEESAQLDCRMQAIRNELTEKSSTCCDEEAKQ